MDPRLQAIYDELPDVPCKGLCFKSCSFIGTFAAERQSMEREGLEPMRVTHGTCPWLDFAGRCSHHDSRPLICRMYGATEELRCEHGCEPERWLSADEAREYMARIEALAPGQEGMSVEERTLIEIVRQAGR